jgi:hypothetical protein
MFKDGLKESSCFLFNLYNRRLSGYEAPLIVLIEPGVCKPLADGLACIQQMSLGLD